MAFEFVEQEKANHKVVTLCRVLGVSTSGYYAWRKRPVSRRTQENQVLKEYIKVIHIGSRGTYGAPRIRAALFRQGIHCGRKRVARLMNELGIEGISRHRRRGCTRRDPKSTPFPDRVKRRFVADRPGQLLVADITQHPTEEGNLYIAGIVDAFSRRVVGWAMGARATAELVQKALEMALSNRKVQAGAIHHSDHGAQYTSYAFGRALQEAGIHASMGSVGDAYDNAMAESFWATLQTELLDRQVWRTRSELRVAVFEYIEVFYNRKRLHSSLGYKSPEEFEAEWAASQMADVAMVA